MADERAPTVAEISVRIEQAKQIFDDHPSMTIAMTHAGEPWIAKVFFVEDEPEPGRLDLCCALLATSRKLAMIRENARLAFVVAGELPDRWIQGTGGAEVVEDDADAAAIHKRLVEKSDAAGPFLDRIEWRALRIHVERMKLTDVASRPPVTEFTFA
jgi:nitroimidazol reductase NimA-like FMN-containing flavoprotein (pyridoxamine 5'-phosphate oxidase superfamily)